LETEEEQAAEASYISRAPHKKGNIRRIILNVHRGELAIEERRSLKGDFLFFFLTEYVKYHHDGPIRFLTSFGRMDGLP